MGLQEANSIPGTGKARSEREIERQEGLVIGLIILTTAMVFGVDISMPLGLGVSILYIAPVMLSVLLDRKGLTYALAAVLSGLVIVAFLFKPSGGPDAVKIHIANRSIIIISIWITAKLSTLAKRTVDLLRSEMAERQAAQVELNNQRERLAITLASIGDGVIATDRDGRVLLMNRVAQDLVAWRADEAVGHDIDDVLVLTEGRDGRAIPSLARQVMAADRIIEMPGDMVLRTRDGRQVSIADSAAPVKDEQGAVAGAVLVFRDVTVQMRFLREMERTGRLESMGLLAGGIAHDFNNILTVIEGKIAVARLRLGQCSEIGVTLDEANRAAERGKLLARQLLTFARGGEPVKRRVDLRNTIIDSTRFALAGSNVDCRFDVPQGLWSAEVDEGQIGQVLQNLVINAKEAMPRGGMVEVSARNLSGENGEGRSVGISVRDNGPGIPESVMPHIFDPFYSTKGEGRGLGLAIAHSIVQKHDGSILVESRVGSGTTFTLKLPSDGTTIERPIEKTAAPQTGTGRVLWMDDEPGVLEVGGEILSILGYEVECARDGEEAIVAYRKAKEAGRPFDLVILDLTVPGAMGGEDAIKRLKAFDPGAKAVVCSGYSNSPITSDFREHGFEGVLQKPFNVNELSALAKQMVDVHSRRSP